MPHMLCLSLHLYLRLRLRLRLRLCLPASLPCLPLFPGFPLLLVCHAGILSAWHLQTCSPLEALKAIAKMVGLKWAGEKSVSLYDEERLLKAFKGKLAADWVAARAYGVDLSCVSDELAMATAAVLTTLLVEGYITCSTCVRSVNRQGGRTLEQTLRSQLQVPTKVVRYDEARLLKLYLHCHRLQLVNPPRPCCQGHLGRRL